jgi:hypothetical protein
MATAPAIGRLETTTSTSVNIVDPPIYCTTLESIRERNTYRRGHLEGSSNGGLTRLRLLVRHRHQDGGP